jgi:hypothetical protein
MRSYRVYNARDSHGVPNHILDCTAKFMNSSWMNPHIFELTLGRNYHEI